jgi:hypothetical protein
MPEVYTDAEAAAAGNTDMAGRPKYRQMRAFLLFSTFNPMFGYAPLANPGAGEPKLQIEVTGLEQLEATYLGPNGTERRSLGFPSADPKGDPLATTVYITAGGHWAGRNIGGYEGFMHTLMTTTQIGKVWTNHNSTRGTQSLAKCRKSWRYELEPCFFGKESIASVFPTGGTGTAVKQEYYPFQTSLLKVGSSAAEQGQGVTGYSHAVNYTDPLEHPDGVGLLVKTYDGSLPNTTFKFHGNTNPIVVKLFYDSETHFDMANASSGYAKNTRSATKRGVPIQEIRLKFPDSTDDWPVPRGDDDDGSIYNASFNPWAKANFFPAPYPVVTKANDQLWPYYWQFNGGLYPRVIRGGAPVDTGVTWWFEFFGKPPYSTTNIAKPLDYPTPKTPGGITVPTLTVGLGVGPNAVERDKVLKCGLEPAWSFASRVLWAGKNSEGIDRPTNTTTGSPEAPYGWYENRFLNIVQPGDTIRSLFYGNPPTPSLTASSDGDLRIAASQSVIEATEFNPHPDYKNGNVQRACGLRTGSGTRYLSESTLANNTGWNFVSNNQLSPLARGGTWFGNLVEPDTVKPAGIWAGKFLQQDRAPANLPVSFPNLLSKESRGTGGGVMGVVRKDNGGTKIGDFDTGMGNFADGPYANKPDEGNVVFAWFDQINRVWHYPIPYFTYTWAYEEPGDTFTSPMRQMPSPAMIGSLPRRPMSKAGWETICLTPYPAGDQHPGNDYPKDHLLLDLFSMPVVEPYPISEPFSTAGKINMNYRIVPFNYITRSTALRAAMAPIRVTGVPQNDYRTYKVGEVNSDGNAKNPQVRLTDNYRKLLDANKPVDSAADLTVISNTLQGFEDYFDQARISGDPDLGIFKSASQICEMPLWPLGESSIVNFWAKNLMTGDNVREKPYADLYPRLTTKSNTFTVHFKVQTLRQVPRNVTSNPNAYGIWEEGKDNVLGEYRGATTIERYIDPSDTRLNKWDASGAANKEYINPDLTAFDPTQNPATPTSAANPSRSLELIYRFRTVMNKKFAP